MWRGTQRNFQWRLQPASLTSLPASSCSDWLIPLPTGLHNELWACRLGQTIFLACALWALPLTWHGRRPSQGRFSSLHDCPVLSYTNAWPSIPCAILASQPGKPAEALSWPAAGPRQEMSPSCCRRARARKQVVMDGSSISPLCMISLSSLMLTRCTSMHSCSSLAPGFASACPQDTRHPSAPDSPLLSGSDPSGWVS